MNIFEAAGASIVLGLLLGFILIIIELMVDTLDWIIGKIGLIVGVLGIVGTIVLAIAGLILQNNPENFKRVGSAVLKEDAGNVYYIDPEDDSIKMVEIKGDTTLYATTSESHIEFTRASWLCFYIDEVKYYVHIDE